VLKSRVRTSPSLAAAALALLAGAAASLAQATAQPATPGGQAAQPAVRPHAGMLRFPDVSATSIVFVYANDLWVVPREGGVARPLASPPGAERFPRFSPDGKSIAFMGNYDGNLDLYTVSVDGGIPTRITHHPGAEQLTDWTADNRLIWFGGGLGGNPRIAELWTTPATGGMPSKLPVPYGANGAISPDGAWLAYTPHTIDGRTWKRYRGGMATDIWLFNLKDKTSRQATDWEGTDSQPMWHGSKLYYMSDAGPEHRLNIWMFDPATGKREQVTTFKDYDIKWPAIGPGDKGQGEIVLQNGSSLYLVDLGTRQARTVNVTIPGARPQLRTRSVDASRTLRGASLSPSAKRAAVEARGDIWTAPAEKGTPRNLTRTSGVFERDPAWSPNGKWIAYFADTTGEYELYIIRSDGRDADGDLGADPVQLTKENLGGGGPFKFNAQWSPDSRSIVFQDKTGARFLYTLAEDLTKVDDPKPDTKADEAKPDAEKKDAGEGEKKEPAKDDKPADTKAEAKADAAKAKDDKKGEKAPDKAPAVAGIVQFDKDPRNNISTVSFSHDSRYIAYMRGNDENPGASVWIYDTQKKERHRITSGFFDDADVTFDRAGDWLYISSSRQFSPSYGELDTSFVYANTHAIIAVPLRKDVKSPYLPTSDEEEFGKKKDDKKKDDARKDDAKKDDSKGDEKNDAAKADDAITGTWSCKATGPQPLPPDGLPFSLSLKLEDATKVSGTFTSIMFNGPITGTWDAAAKLLTLNFQAGEQPITLTLNVAGSSLSGSVVVNEQKFTISGDRTGAGAKDEKKADDKKEPAERDKKDDKGDKDKKKTFEIDYDGIEARAFELPIRPGVFGGLGVNDKGQLLFVRRSARGDDAPPAIKLFDPKDEKKDEKTVADGAGGFELSADGKKLLVFRGGAPLIQDASAGASAKPVVTSPMLQAIEPRAEWDQVLKDVHRIFRDWFYVGTMHGLDWNATLKHYQEMLPDCANREDVNYIISEMISELNVGHAYLQAPGDVESGGPTVGVGVLGCDFELAPPQAATADKPAAPAAYRIARIIRAAAWDTDARSPLDRPGVDVKEGDYLLAVNGVPMDTTMDPWAAFVGLEGRAVVLTVSQNPAMDTKARNVVVETLGSDAQLRYRAWIESKRKYVEDKTEGKVGYIYVPNTGVDGQNDLVRQFYGQIGKQALIIDERWNGGGQIPTRFIELLNRPATNFWAVRDAKDWQWPPDSHQGPKCMLINGLAGSGGDMFPWLFRHNKLGKLIGSRTWGGLVGISGNPGLIDGGTISVPTFGFYELDGTWGIEGHGVDPDLPVVDDPAKMQDGNDPQLNAAIDLMLSEIKSNGFRAPKRPADPDRRGMGIPEADR
jgi:tricorn protease-like protein/C-terminal processing protease CtpA/Prc